MDDDGVFGVATSWTGLSRQVLELASRESIAELTGRFATLYALGPGRQLTYAGHDLDRNTGQSFVVSTDCRLAHHGERIYVGAVGNAHDLAVSKDGRYAALATRNQMSSAVHVVDLQQKQLVRTLDEPAHAVALSHSADLLAVGIWNKAQLYCLSGSEYLGPCHVGNGDVGWIGFARQHVAFITTEGSLMLFSFDGHNLERQYRCEIDVASSWTLASGDHANRRRIRAAISPDGELIAVRERKKGLKVIRPSDGACQTLSGHTDRINLVRFVRDGQLLVSADLDNRVILWPRLELDDESQLVADKIVPISRPTRRKGVDPRGDRRDS